MGEVVSSGVVRLSFGTWEVSGRIAEQVSIYLRRMR